MTLGAFFDQKLVHQFNFFYAPKILGGEKAPGMVGGHGISSTWERPISPGP